MRYVETYIALPPGAPAPEGAEALLRRILEGYKWFFPERYGFGITDKQLPSQQPINYGPLLDCFRKFKALSISTRNAQHCLTLYSATSFEAPYTGRLVWSAPQRAMLGAAQREVHIQQVAELMALIRSPLAFTAMSEDSWQKRNRMIDRGSYQEEAPTVKGYGEGLAGLYWRNFYGPLFVRLFGERLHTLPSECVTRLGEELVLVQPYELPTEAGTEAARAREQQLISLLSPECFYDHEHHRPPTRRPVLPPPPWPAPAT
jgi:hypothetical protein